MKLTINRETLLTPLQLISGVVERKQTMPVLANVLLAAESGLLQITGTNMEVELVCDIDQLDVASPGRITVPARKLSDICRSLPDQATIELSLEGDKLFLRSGKSQFTLSTLPADHFPNIEHQAQDLEVNIAQGDFKRMIDSTAFAMAQQDVRYYLNGMLLDIADGHVRAVSTDGHRLAMSSVGAEVAANRQVIVPRKGILELARLLSDSEETVTLYIGDSHLRTRVGSFSFTSKLIEGKFPDYNRVIPRGGDKIVIADRKLLKSTLSRAAILSHENIRGIRVQLSNNNLQVFANNPEHEQAEDSVPVTYMGEDLQIGFNVGYLIDVLNVISDEQVKITLSNPNASALVESAENDENLYVVMPMRL